MTFFEIDFEVGISESAEKSIDKATDDFNKNLKERKFQEADQVLIKVKDFKGKNRKLCEEWKGPYIVVKVHPNNTVLIKKKFGKHDLLYNANMLKLYKPEDWTKKNKKRNERANRRSNGRRK